MYDRSYCTAADLAREVGCDRTTVVEWIKQGEIKAVAKQKPNERYKIYEKYFKPKVVKKLKNKRYCKNWSSAELSILKMDIDKDLETLCKVLPNRSKTAIMIKRCRYKKMNQLGI